MFQTRRVFVIVNKLIMILLVGTISLWTTSCLTQEVGTGRTVQGDPFEDETLQELISACSWGNQSKVKEILSARNELLYQYDSRGFSAIEAAMSSEFATHIIAYLLSQGVTCDLRVASALNDVARIRMCLTNIEDVNAIDSIGFTPLRYAVIQGNIEAVDILLEAGADPNIQDDEGKTALFSAVRVNELAIAKRLLTAGAKTLPYQSISGEQSSLLFLADSGDMVHLLVQYGCDPNEPDSEGSLPIFSLNDDALIALLDYHQDLSVRGRSGETVLMHAAWGSSYACVTELIQKGVDLYETDDLGDTAAHKAIRSGNPTALLALLDAGMDMHWPLSSRYWGAHSG